VETAVVEVGLQGGVCRWGRAAERVFGFTDAGAVGHPPPMIPYDLRADVLERVRAAEAGATPPDHATVWCDRDGAPIEVDLSMSALGRPGDGQTVVLIARDISARRLEQAQLAAYATDVRESFGRELRRARELERSYFATVRALAAAVEAKDGYTGAHIQRVHSLGLLLAGAVAPDDAGDPQLGYGFLLHDIGKLGVPDAVLTKPGPLSDAEWGLMRDHPRTGARMLEPVPFLDRAVDVVRHHHERWDGDGYPARLEGEEIPLWARIFAVADTVDAIVSDRPYRRGRPLEDALEEVAARSGTQFDPTCAEAMTALDPGAVHALVDRA